MNTAYFKQEALLSRRKSPVRKDLSGRGRILEEDFPEILSVSEFSAEAHRGHRGQRDVPGNVVFMTFFAVPGGIPIRGSAGFHVQVPAMEILGDVKMSITHKSCVDVIRNCHAAKKSIIQVQREIESCSDCLSTGVGRLKGGSLGNLSQGGTHGIGGSLVVKI